jgi:aquaporin Z
MNEDGRINFRVREEGNRLDTAWSRFRDHLPEYVIEAFGLGSFMVSACFFSVLLFHSDSDAARSLPEPAIRRLLAGFAMGITLVMLVYSPFGRRSGAHLNPAVTFAFWRLGRVKSTDAVCYAIFQTLGGYLGVVLSAAILGPRLADRHVHFATTVPGPYPVYLVWFTEFIMSATMFGAVLFIGGRKGWESRTGLVAASLLVAFIFFASPVSGTSLNPSRSLATAAVSGDWNGIAIYLTAPLMAMLTVAELTRLSGRLPLMRCAKLVHSAWHRCIFCGYSPASVPAEPKPGCEINSPAA